MKRGDRVPAGAVLLVATSDDTSEVRFTASSDREVTQAPAMDVVDGLGGAPAFDVPPVAAVPESRGASSRPHLRSLFADSIGPFDPRPVQPRSPVEPAKSDASKYRRSQSEATPSGTPRESANLLPPWRSSHAGPLSWMPSVTEGVPFSFLPRRTHGRTPQTPVSGRTPGAGQSDDGSPAAASKGEGTHGGGTVEARGDSASGTHGDPGDPLSGPADEGTSMGSAPSSTSAVTPPSRSPGGPSRSVPGASPAREIVAGGSAAITPNRLQLLFADVEPAGEGPRDTASGSRAEQQAAAERLPATGGTAGPRGATGKEAAGDTQLDTPSPSQGLGGGGTHGSPAGARQVRGEDLAEPEAMAEPEGLAEPGSMAEPASSPGATNAAPDPGVGGSAPAVAAPGTLVPTVPQGSQGASISQGNVVNEVEPRDAEASVPSPGNVNRLTRLFLHLPAEDAQVGSRPLLDIDCVC